MRIVFAAIVIMVMLASPATADEGPCKAPPGLLAGLADIEIMETEETLHREVFLPGKEEYIIWAKAQKVWSPKIGHSGARQIFDLRLATAEVARLFDGETCDAIAERSARIAYAQASAQFIASNIDKGLEAMRRSMLIFP
ncbi:MAG: hypothetical protein AAB597_03415 [Patescibacteria group bacterium]